MLKVLLVLVGVVGTALGQQTGAPCYCGQQVYNLMPGNPRSINSANWPNSYPGGCNCQYNVTAPPGYKVGLSFPFFFLGSTDVLIITDLPSGASHSCYGVRCASMNSTGQTLSVRFISKNSGPGFQMNFAAVQRRACQCGSPVLQVGRTGVLALSSPMYANGGFAGSCNCVWHVGTAMGNKLAFSFVNHTQFNQMCFTQGNATIGGTCCGQMSSCPKSVKIMSNWMTISFSSSYGASGGFMGAVTASKIQPCDSRPCKNGGTCNNVASASSGYQCNCMLGYTGVTCSLPGCFLTLTNSGSYVLRATYSSSTGATSTTLLPSQQKFFTAITDTYLTLQAIFGRSTRIWIPQCKKDTVVCQGTTIIGFRCTYTPGSGAPARDLEFYDDPSAKLIDVHEAEPAKEQPQQAPVMEEVQQAVKQN